MSDIFREVDEALSREKAARFWKDYGPTLVAAAIILVASTAATTAYRTWDGWRDREETAKIFAAFEQKDVAPALEQAAADTRKGHKALALLNAAAQYSSDKDFAKAAGLYKSVAEDSATPDDLRDLATIYEVRASLLAQQGKTPDYKAYAEKLAPIAKNGKSTFHLQASLDAALLYGDGLKDYTAALDLLKGFDTDSVSDSLREKATALQHVYEYELSQSKPANAAPAQKQ